MWSPRLINVEDEIAFLLQEIGYFEPQLIQKVTKFGQLILRKITKIVATTRQILRLKCTKIQFRQGVYPRPCWGSLQRSPDPLAGFKRAYFQEEETTGEERERKGSRGGREASPKKSLNRPWFTFS